MLELLKKDRQAAALTPAEKAALKLFWSALLSGAFVAVEAIVTTIQHLHGSSPDWSQIIRDAIILALFTTVHTLFSYFQSNQRETVSNIAEKELDKVFSSYHGKGIL